MKELPIEFIGTGDVKDDVFKLINKSPKAYIYTRKNFDIISYEVFQRKEAKETTATLNGTSVHFEAKVKYPRSEDFGVWAWYYDKYDDAVNKFVELSNAPDKVLLDQDIFEV